MWLDVSITDASGKLLLRSGELDKEGNIDKNAVQYYTQLGNEKGQPVLNAALADRILYDYRIPPKGYVIEKYAFYIPDDVTPPVNIDVSLKYRSASQKLANTLLGNDAPEIPVIVMTESKEEIKM